MKTSQQIAILTCIVLIFVLGMIYLLFPEPKNYFLNLDGNRTYKAGNLNIVVGNNGINSPKILNIYGVDDASPPSEVFTSLLATQTGKVIDNLTLGDESIYYIGNNDFPVSIWDVDPAEPLQSGSYSGFLYVNNGTLTSVPITLFTEPKIVQAVIVVVIGVVASILFWEIFFVLSGISLRKGSETLLEEAIHLANNPPPELADQTRREKITQFQSRSNHQLNRALEIEYRYLTKASRIVSAEVGTVAFGILTGLVGLTNNSYVTNLVEIDWLDGAILFGIGLGLGSLKGLVDH